MIKITIQSGAVTKIIEVESLKDLKGDLAKAVIRQAFTKELAIARNKTDAVLNTATLLDVAESTVWRALE